MQLSTLILGFQKLHVRMPIGKPPRLKSPKVKDWLRQCFWILSKPLHRNHLLIRVNCTGIDIQEYQPQRGQRSTMDRFTLGCQYKHSAKSKRSFGSCGNFRGREEENEFQSVAWRDAKTSSTLANREVHVVLCGALFKVSETCAIDNANNRIESIWQYKVYFPRNRPWCSSLAQTCLLRRHSQRKSDQDMTRVSNRNNTIS